MGRLIAGLACGVMLVAGCAEQPSKDSQSGGKAKLKTPADALTDGDMRQFLEVVNHLPQRRVPEFSPEPHPEFDTLLSASQLVEKYRERFRTLFDPVRQGKVWLRDHDLRAATREAKLTTAQFAALVRSISCALMKAELEPRQNLKQLVADCRGQVQNLSHRIDQIDKLPQAELTGDLAYERTQAALRLGRMVALLEFTELLLSVPADNVALIEKHRQALAPLTPAGSTERWIDPFAIENQPEEVIQQTGFEQ